MLRMAFRIWHDEHGQDLIEYALLVGLAALIAASMPFQTTMGLLTQIYERVNEQFERLCGT